MKGVYPRVKPAWNKGKTKYSPIIERIKQILAIQPLTIQELLGHLGDANLNYKKLQWLIRRARETGQIVFGVKEGRGIKNKGAARNGIFRRKYQIGDKVRINPDNLRTPEYIKASLRLDTPRTITGVSKVTDGHRGSRYYLGSNRMGKIDIEPYPFRAEELIPYRKKARGRPCHKRPYNRKSAQGVGNIPEAGEHRQNSSHSQQPSILCVN